MISLSLFALLVFYWILFALTSMWLQEQTEKKENEIKREREKETKTVRAKCMNGKINGVFDMQSKIIC